MSYRAAFLSGVALMAAVGFVLTVVGLWRLAVAYISDGEEGR